MDSVATYQKAKQLAAAIIAAAASGLVARRRKLIGGPRACAVKRVQGSEL